MKLSNEIRKCKLCDTVLNANDICANCSTVHAYNIDNRLSYYYKRIVIGQNIYYVDFDVIFNNTRITCYNGSTSNREVFKTTGLLNITSQNIEEKIKLYETFR